MRLVVPSVGLSVLWLYFRAHQLSFLTATLNRDIASSQIAYTSFAISFAALAILVACLGPGLSAFIRSHASHRATALLAGVGVASELLMWLPLPEEMQAAAYAIGSTLGAVFFVLAILCYGMLLAAETPRNAAIISFASFGLCFLSNLFYYLPVPLEAAIRMACPLVCVGGMAQLAHGASGKASSQSTAHEQPLSPVRTLTSAGFPIVLMILLALFCLTGHLARGITDPWFSFSGPTWRSLLMSGINIAAVALSVALLVRGLDVRRVLFWNWSLFMLMFLVGLLGLVFMPPDIQPYASDLVTTARVCFTLLMFLVAVLALPDMPFGVTRLIGLLLLVPEAISGLVRFIGVPAFLGQAFVNSSTVISYVGIGIVSALLVAIIVMLNAMLMGQTGPGLRDDGHPPEVPAASVQATSAASDAAPSATGAQAQAPLSHDEALDQLAKQHGLTARELECARIFSHGYSLEKTADTMFVSINTVRTHLKNAYSKLGIHSRQELMDAIDTQAQQASQTS